MKSTKSEGKDRKKRKTSRWIWRAIVVPLAPEFFPGVLNSEYLLPRGCILWGLDESERLALEERHGAGVRPWRGKMEEKRRRVVLSSNLHERPGPSGRLSFHSIFTRSLLLNPDRTNKNIFLTILRTNFLVLVCNLNLFPF